MTSDGLMEQFRGEQALEETPRKRLGLYNSHEVEQYIQRLLERMHHMEMMYQRQYEEIRTGLLGITRERDDLRMRLKEMEARFSDVPSDWIRMLREQGQEVFSVAEAEQLRRAREDFLENMESITRERDQGKETIRQLNLRHEEQSEQLRCTQEDARALRRKAEALEIELESVRCQAQEKTEALVRIQAREEAAIREAELARQQADHLEQELASHRQRWDMQRESLIHRYQSVLHSQQQCMQRLQESFIASVKCMQSLGEANLVNYPADEETQ